MTDMSTISNKSSTSAERVKPDVAGKVRPLEWVSIDDAQRSITVCGMYAIHPSSGAYGKPTLTLTGMPGNLFGKFATVEEAKAAAQADYAARILSALTPDALAPIPAGEVAEMVEKLRGANPDRLSPIDGLRLFDSDSGTFPLSPEDAEAILETIDDAADLLSRMAGETWQPIETAPKDGSTILCYFPLEGLTKEWCRVVPVAYRGDRWDFASRAASGFSREFLPTHWRPLPQAPK